MNLMEHSYYNMDCMEGMRQFPDDYFSLAIVDPPYFSGPNKRGYYGQEIEEWLWDEMGGNDKGSNLSETVFKDALKKTKEKYNPYWKKVIVVHADN